MRAVPKATLQLGPAGLAPPPPKQRADRAAPRLPGTNRPTTPPRAKPKPSVAPPEQQPQPGVFAGPMPPTDPPPERRLIAGLIQAGEKQRRQIQSARTAQTQLRQQVEGLRAQVARSSDAQAATNILVQQLQGQIQLLVDSSMPALGQQPSSASVPTPPPLPSRRQRRRQSSQHVHRSRSSKRPPPGARHRSFSASMSSSAIA